MINDMKKGLRKNCIAFKFTGTLHWAKLYIKQQCNSALLSTDGFHRKSISEQQSLESYLLPTIWFLQCFTLCFIQSQCHHPSPLFHDKWHEKGLKKNCSAFKFTGTMHWAFASPNVTFGSLNHNVTIFTGTTVNCDELICFALCFIQSQSTMSPVFCIETI